MNKGSFRLRVSLLRTLGLRAMIGCLAFGIATASVAISQGPNATDHYDFWQFTETPTGRAGHLAAWTGTELIVWGGSHVTSPPYISNEPTDAGRYNPALGKWSRLSATNAPESRQVATAVWTGREMIVWGGYENRTKYVHTGARYRPDTDTWGFISTNGAPSARGYHSAVWTGSEMLIWGGTEAPNGTNMPSRTGAAYNPITDTWRTISTQGAPAARSEHVAVWTGSEMLVWGGQGSSYPMTGGARYNPQNDSWAAITSAGAPLGDVLERYTTAIWTGNEMIIWGGFNIGARYNPVSNTWRTITTTGAPTSRLSHSAVWAGTEMLVWGGIDNDGGRYNPVSNTWLPLTSENAPSKRTGHSAVWTGSQMLVWGGTYNKDNQGGIDPRDVRIFSYSDGGQFDPISATWTRFGTPQTVTSRYMHTAVWTGNEMVIWGGFGSLRDGGRYDPISNHLTPIAETTITGRRSHTAVWTGREMIVWGGWYERDPEYRSLNNGARYDPQQDRWTLLSTSGAPSARYTHSAVWTGKEMLIWGGTFYGQPSVVLNTGGRYDPESDSWRPISTNGTPSPRLTANAVWTGREMIVWGGSGGFSANPPTDGARYDPVTDAWTPITTNGAPVARSYATAVWTGKEMIVWGGETFDGSSLSLFGDGARYDPVEDKWRALASVGAPSARTHHTAVWTGREMVVWGGTRFNFTEGPLADGARYDPAADRWLPITQTGAPDGRESHTAVWTGTGMVIAGGINRNGVPQGDIVVYNPTLPTLSITSADENTATIQWPFPTTGFRPQKTDDLSRPDWVDVQGEFSHHGANWLLNVNPTNQSFFRLKEE